MSMLQTFNRMMGERMASSGRMAMIETVGRVSGRQIRTPVGWAQGPEDRIWVGAGREESHWPKNLLANPRCRVQVGSGYRECVAVPLDGEERANAVAAIHAKYGGPALRVGAGPVFALVPTAD